MWIELLFYTAFLSQILLITYHYPKRILSRMDYIFEHYPADKYAKLYPKGYQKTLEGKILYKLLNNIILLFGFAIFVGFVIANQQGHIELKNVNFLPFVYGFLQAVPFLILEVSAHQQFKLMRSLNAQTKRQADLSPRNLFNYLSPIRLFSTVSLFFICTLVMLALNDFKMSASVATLLGSLVLCNGLFVFLGYLLLQGKKQDPHQSPEDRHTMTTTAFRSYTSISMLASVFFIINRCVFHFSLETWEPLLNSLYWQSVVLLSTGTMLRFTKLTQVNYEVYKTTTHGA
ncbi:hypothetical protein [uncultured Paraglaciecola sp.]|uniref:hypothetical protein n=1 Tax=uncultured Paraglaciecola sp. TaxID=1765024 RepID=UPI0026387F5C|nr:hypothetical protein [uncultured Paraglaciecola sp.]